MGQTSETYGIIEGLCKEKNIKVSHMCSEIDLRPSVMSDLKHGRSKSLSMGTLRKIAQYFQVSTDVFF